VLEYKKKCTDEQCIGQSPVNISDSTRHLQRCVVNYSLHKLAPAPILRDVTWGTLARPWVHPPAQLCCPKVAPEFGPLSAPVPERPQDNAEEVSYCQGKLQSLAMSPSVSEVPASSQFNPFCSLAVLPSMPDNSLATNYHC